MHEPFHGPLMQHWSLAVEEHFYLIAPACLLWFGRRQWRGIVATLAAVLVLALVARSYWMMVLPQASVVDYVYRATECRLDSIAFGVLLAVMAHRADTRHLVAAISKPWAASIGFGLLAVLLLWQNDAFKLTARFSLQGVALFLIIAGLVFSDGRSILKTVLNWRPVVFIGQISFVLYLFHDMTYQALKVTLGDPPMVIMLPIGTAAAVLVSWLVFASIERPMIRIGKRRLAARKARRATASVNGTACRIIPAMRQAPGGAAR